MTSVLWKATLGQLTRDLSMEHPFRAHLLSTHPDLMNIQVPQTRQPAPPRMTLHVLPLSCPLLPCQASPRFTRPPRCVPRNQRPRRVFPLAISSLRRQPLKPSPCPTILPHRFARANRHHRLQLPKYVLQKCRPNMTMPSVAASRKGLSSQKVFR